jgi:hypothetical protein
VLIVINLRLTPSVCPAETIVEFADISKLPVPTVAMVLDSVTLPAITRLAFIVKVLAYPVQFKLSGATVLAATVQAGEVALNITSSATPGTPEGDQLPAVPQLPATVQIFIAIVKK